MEAITSIKKWTSFSQSYHKASVWCRCHKPDPSTLFHCEHDLLKDLLSPVEQLIASGATEKVLKEGAQAPDFTLPDALGNAVTLSHLLRKGPVVISFYRGEWCPYCNLELRAYQRVLPQLQEARAIISGSKDRITTKLEEERLLNPFEIHHTQQGIGIDQTKGVVDR